MDLGEIQLRTSPSGHALFNASVRPTYGPRRRGDAEIQEGAETWILLLRVKFQSGPDGTAVVTVVRTRFGVDEPLKLDRAPLDFGGAGLGNRFTPRRLSRVTAAILLRRDHRVCGR